MARAAARVSSDFSGEACSSRTGGLSTRTKPTLRESILQPNAKIVAGYQPLMPTFQGQVTEEGVLELIEYIKSLVPRPRPGPERLRRRST